MSRSLLYAYNTFVYCRNISEFRNICNIRLPILNEIDIVQCCQSSLFKEMHHFMERFHIHYALFGIGGRWIYFDYLKRIQYNLSKPLWEWQICSVYTGIWFTQVQITDI